MSASTLAADTPTAGIAPTPVVTVAPTLDGWYAHHQLFTIDRAALRALGAEARRTLAERAAAALGQLARPDDGGWSAPVQLIGATAELMVVHFRPTLDALGDAQRAVLREPLADFLRPAYTFLSVTEAGMYAAAAKTANEAAARGGVAGDEEYQRTLAARLEAEAATPHVQKRIYPPAPTDAMPYVCFYPMSKRRAVGQNWYALPMAERSRLMWEHGKTGRKYAGRVFQIITGSVGFDAWEWAVTLFAADPMEFKRIVTEMRFDEASAQYAEFGDFWVGRVVTPAEWVAAIVA
jgi:hydrogen peroxide-dependent heme synthase